jgi:hypothetical protein
MFTTSTGIGEKSVEVMHRQGLLTSIFSTRERERERERKKLVIRYFQFKLSKNLWL